MAYRALLIGVGAYAHFRSLPGALQDVPTVRRALTDRVTGLFREEDVATLVDPTKLVLEEQLTSFLEGGEMDDISLVYFSGHGKLASDRSLVLCAADTRPGRLPTSGTPAAVLQSVIRDRRARTLVLVLDCCHSGAFSERGEGAGFLEEQDARQLVPKSPARRSRGVFILASSRALQAANDGDGTGPSPFTQVFARTLVSVGASSRDPLTIDDVYEALDEALSPLGQFPQRVMGEGSVELTRVRQEEADVAASVPEVTGPPTVRDRASPAEVSAVAIELDTTNLAEAPAAPALPDDDSSPPLPHDAAVEVPSLLVVETGGVPEGDEDRSAREPDRQFDGAEEAADASTKGGDARTTPSREEQPLPLAEAPAIPETNLSSLVVDNELSSLDSNDAPAPSSTAMGVASAVTDVEPHSDSEAAGSPLHGENSFERAQDAEREERTEATAIFQPAAASSHLEVAPPSEGHEAAEPSARFASGAPSPVAVAPIKDGEPVPEYEDAAGPGQSVASNDGGEPAPAPAKRRRRKVGRATDQPPSLGTSPAPFVAAPLPPLAAVVAVPATAYDESTQHHAAAPRAGTAGASGAVSSAVTLAVLAVGAVAAYLSGAFTPTTPAPAPSVSLGETEIVSTELSNEGDAVRTFVPGAAPVDEPPAPEDPLEFRAPTLSATPSSNPDDPDDDNASIPDSAWTLQAGRNGTFGIMLGGEVAVCAHEDSDGHCRALPTSRSGSADVSIEFEVSVDGTPQSTLSCKGSFVDDLKKGNHYIYLEPDVCIGIVEMKPGQRVAVRKSGATCRFDGDMRTCKTPIPGRGKTLGLFLVPFVDDDGGTGGGQAKAVSVADVPPTRPGAARPVPGRPRPPSEPSRSEAERASDVAPVVAGMTVGFQRCYERGLGVDPAMRGKIRILATLGSKGEVESTSATAVSGNLSAEVTSCAQAVVSSGRFDPPKGGAVSIAIPLTFAPK